MPYYVLEDALLHPLHELEAANFDDALAKAGEAVDQALTFDGDGESPYWLVEQLRNKKAEWVEPARPVYRAG